MKRLTVGELIEELQRFDKDKLVFIDDDSSEYSTTGLITLQKVLGIESPNKSEINGHVYLLPSDE